VQLDIFGKPICLKVERMIDQLFQRDAAARFIQKVFRGYKARKRILKLKAVQST